MFKLDCVSRYSCGKKVAVSKSGTKRLWRRHCVLCYSRISPLSSGKSSDWRAFVSESEDFSLQDAFSFPQDTETREEGGTGAVVESVRAGLVMQLKEAVGVPAIMAREEKICK